MIPQIVGLMEHLAGNNPLKTSFRENEWGVLKKFARFSAAASSAAPFSA
jgi:hypothetical protein